MRRATRVRYTLFLTVVVWAVFIPGAQAYIDPGSTSIIFSAVVAGLAAAGTVFAMLRDRLARFFRRTSPEDAEQTTPQS